MICIVLQSDRCRSANRGGGIRDSGSFPDVRQESPVVYWPPHVYPAKGAAPLYEIFPSGAVALFVEQSHHGFSPALARGVVFAIDDQPRLLHVLAEMVVVEPQGIHQ